MGTGVGPLQEKEGSPSAVPGVSQKATLAKRLAWERKLRETLPTYAGKGREDATYLQLPIMHMAGSDCIDARAAHGDPRSWATTDEVRLASQSYRSFRLMALHRL